LLAALCLLSRGLAADDTSGEEETLARACNAGLGALDKRQSCGLNVERIGATLRLWADSNKRVIVCHLCTDAEARAAAYGLGAMMAEDSTNQPNATLELELELSEWSVRLDGIELSEEMLPVPMATGMHTLEALSIRNETTGVEFAVEPGAHVVAHAAIQAPKGGRLAWRPKDYVSWSVGAVGAGLTLGAVGGFLLWQDGRCTRPTDEQGLCPREVETTLAGAVAVASGALLEAIALWWLWPRQTRQRVLTVEDRP
jgi:hypothetical protein